MKQQSIGDEKRKQIQGALLKNFGIDKKNTIDSVLKTFESQLTNNNIMKTIESEVKNKLKDVDKMKDNTANGSNVNKKIENLHKKLNMYQSTKPRPADKPNKVKTPENSILQVKYDDIYNWWISNVVGEWLCPGIKNPENQNGMVRKNSTLSNNKDHVAKMSSKAMYDPGAINKLARSSLSTKNLGLGNKLAKDSVGVKTPVKEGKVETANNKANNFKTKSSQINGKNLVSAQNQISKIKGSTQSQKIITVKELSNPKTSGSNVQKNKLSTPVAPKNVLDQNGVQAAPTPSIHPKKYMVKLEKFYTDLLTEIKEENVNDNDVGNAEHILGYK